MKILIRPCLFIFLLIVVCLVLSFFYNPVAEHRESAEIPQHVMVDDCTPSAMDVAIEE